MLCRIKDLDIYYEEAGSGRPLLLLHGWPLDHRHMANEWEPLFATRSGWRRLYLDLPGMGQTRGPDWITCQDQVLEVVMGFMESVAPGQRFAAAGTSYGSRLARGLVHRCGAEMDGVALNVPGIELDPAKQRLPEPKVVHEDADFLAALGPDEQDMRGFIVVQSLELLADFRRFFQPAAAVADNAFLERLDKLEAYAFSFDVNALPTPFPAPALFLTGRQDNWCGYREAYQLLDDYPRATFAVLDRAGHALACEQTTLFRALAGEWLDRVEEYAATRSRS